MTDLNRLKLKQIHPQLCTQLGIDLSASHNVISLPCVSELKCYQQLKTRLEGALKTKKKKKYYKHTSSVAVGNIHSTGHLP